MASALVLLLLSPFIIWFFRRKTSFLHNLLQVITARKTWVGYIGSVSSQQDLPYIKPGVLTPADIFSDKKTAAVKDSSYAGLNMLYARDYSIITDAEILLKGWKKIGL